MNDKDIIEFGKNYTQSINGSISFTNVSYNEDKNKNIFGIIKKTSFNIKPQNIVLFEGKKGCGKRAIFYMLRREIRPSTGTITFDTINIYDFEKDVYSTNLSYVTRKPYFFNDSILSNLKYIEKNHKKIRNLLKYLKIYDDILNLPNGIETNITQSPESLNNYLLFMIGLARSLLTNSEIILIYEFPIGLTHKEQDNIRRIITNLKKTKTIIIFCATNFSFLKYDQHFIIENGNVELKK